MKKSIFSFLIGLSAAKTSLRPESAPLSVIQNCAVCKRKLVPNKNLTSS